MTDARPQIAGSANPNWRGGYSSECTQCGNPVWVVPSVADKPRHFCSKACCNAWMSSVRGEHASGWTGGGVTKTCVQCNSEFTVSKAEAARSPAKYCSRKCMGASKRKRVPKPCTVCGTEFESRRLDAKFCSRKCHHAAMIKRRTPEWYIMRRLNARIGALMWYTLKGSKAGVSWQKLVGYTIADLRAHLESKFTEGMTWANMGEWHIDHIIPRKFFEFSSPNDVGFRQCWSLSNLQPLWAIDNLRKGSSLPAQE